MATDQESMSWQEVAELTHETQVAKFDFCLCEDGPRIYDDCPRGENYDLEQEIALCAKELQRLTGQDYVGFKTGTSLNIGLETLDEIIRLLKTHVTGEID
jgi:hypothetical protein